MTLTVYENLRTGSLNHKVTVFKVYCIRAEIDKQVSSDNHTIFTRNCFSANLVAAITNIGAGSNLLHET